MKKILCLILLFALMLSCTNLVACFGDEESAPESSKIELTLANVNTYLNVIGACDVDTSTNFGRPVFTARASSTSSLVKFYDCTITVAVCGTFGMAEVDYKGNIKEDTIKTAVIEKEIELKLDFGGTASGKVYDNFYDHMNANSYINGKEFASELSYCRIVSVSGYVEEV